jgi:hypothetical protein
MQTAKASTLFNSHGCIVGPPALARIAFYMSKRLAESASLIGLMVLAIK